MTLQSDLTKISKAFGDIKQAIVNKGVVPEGDISTYADAIELIEDTPIITRKYEVMVVDFDGTVLKHETELDIGDTVSLPSQPSHTGLTFKAWSSTEDITSNTVTISNDDILVGATYDTTSGLSEFEITVNKINGKTVTLNMDGTKDWGDGNSDTTTSHTYSQYGTYTIKCNGTTISSSGSSNTLFGDPSKVIVSKIWFAGLTNLGTYTLYNISSPFTLVVPSTATTIGASFAVYVCGLPAVILPDSVTSIGNYAFQSCYGLKYLCLPKNITSLGSICYGCSSLLWSKIPKGVTNMAGTFQSCSHLHELTLPEVLSVTGGNTFSGAPAVSRIPDSLINMSSYDFSGNPITKYTNGALLLPTNTNSVAGFNNCKIRTIVIPSGTTIVGTSAFASNSDLTSVDIPNTVLELYSSAFYNSGLEEVSLPEGLLSIGDSAFRGTKITEITIPSTVTTLGQYAFSETKLTSVTIPNTVTSIGSRLFYNTTSLESVSITNAVTSIPEYFCYGCNLKNVTIPEGIQTISQYAFYGNYGLNSVTFPSTLTTINANAFNGISYPTEYDFRACLAVPTLSATSAFNTGMNSAAKIKVPFGLYSSWVTATNWSVFADFIDGGTPATLNFSLTPSSCDLYVNGELSGTSISYMGTTASYDVYDSTNNVYTCGELTGITEGSTVNTTVDLSTGYDTLTVSTGVSGLTVNFYSGNFLIPATPDGSGNYSVKVKGTGKTISYVISDDNYLDEAGTITTTGSDISVSVTLTPATSAEWTRPNLTENGTLGGSSFAVDAPVYYSSYAAYKAMDSSTTSTNWQSPYGDATVDYVMYSPNSLKVTEFAIRASSSSYIPEAITIFGSANGTSWSGITSTYTYSSSTGTVTISGTGQFFKYYKLHMTKKSSSSYVSLYNIGVTATQKQAAT